MKEVINEILKHETTQRVLDIIYNLDSTEIIILILITVVLTIYMAYRRLGAGAVIGLLIVYGLAYFLYSVDIYNVYNKYIGDQEKQESILEHELKKNGKTK